MPFQILPFIVILSPVDPLELDTENICADWQDVNKKLFPDGLGVEQLVRFMPLPSQLLADISTKEYLSLNCNNILI